MALAGATDVNSRLCTVSAMTPRFGPHRASRWFVSTAGASTCHSLDVSAKSDGQK